MDSYSLGKDIQTILAQLAQLNSKLTKTGCSCSSGKGVTLSDDLADDLLKYGEAVESFFDEVIGEGDWNAERMEKLSSKVEAIRSSKHTYCCKLGEGQYGYYEDCTQFKCYSWQAPLFCVRDAKSRGYSQGSVGRGECTSPPCP